MDVNVQDRLISAPLYMITTPLRAMRARRDMTVRVKAPSGRVIDELAVCEGEWIVREGNDAYTIPDDAFQSRHLPLPGDGRDWVARTHPVRAYVADGKAWIHGAEGPRDADEFLAGAVRCDVSGKPICAAGWPLLRQAKAVLAAGEAAVRHIEALKTLRREAGVGLVVDPAVQSDLHIFDLVIEGPEDEVGDAMASIHAAMPPIRRAPLAVLSHAVGFDPDAWMEVRHLPLYASEGGRAVARSILRPHIGEFPLEYVQAVALEHCEDDALVRRVCAWLGKGEELEPAPAAEHPAMPGYRTSEMRRFRRDGMEFLCFEDFSAAFVYAWPSQQPVQDVSGPHP